MPIVVLPFVAVNLIRTCPASVMTPSILAKDCARMLVPTVKVASVSPVKTPCELLVISQSVWSANGNTGVSEVLPVV